jgi:hypothetical protein
VDTKVAGLLFACGFALPAVPQKQHAPQGDQPPWTAAVMQLGRHSTALSRLNDGCKAAQLYTSIPQKTTHEAQVMG